MHARLLLLLSLVWQALSLTAAKKRSAPKDNRYLHCRGCLECSYENGCLRCPERLFLYLHRDGMSHYGSCLHSCPTGHFGLRGPEANHCIKCKAPDCERCFDKDFCTKCKAGFFLFKGKCFSSCPEGTIAYSTDCLDNCPYGALGYWAEWSPCLYNGLSCGVRWGHQNRTRELPRRVFDKHSALCPPQHESRKCRMKKRCPKDQQTMKKRGERRRAQNRGVRRNRTREPEPPKPV